MLSNKQKEFFENLKKIYGKEPLPSYEIIAKDFGFKHKNSVWQYFNKLKENDLIKEKNGKFFIAPECFGAILFTSSVRAGFATVAEDSIEERISFDKLFALDNPSTFVFNVSGDSMVNAGIFDGDKVVVKKTPCAKNGDIVLAYIDDGYTLKTYREKNGKVWLQPENPDYPIIEPKEVLTIFGVATGIVREL
jgi:SOS regulatory protein LexA